MRTYGKNQARNFAREALEKARAPSKPTLDAASKRSSKNLNLDEEITITQTKEDNIEANRDSNCVDALGLQPAPTTSSIPHDAPQITNDASTLDQHAVSSMNDNDDIDITKELQSGVSCSNSEVQLQISHDEATQINLNEIEGLHKEDKIIQPCQSTAANDSTEETALDNVIPNSLRDGAHVFDQANKSHQSRLPHPKDVKQSNDLIDSPETSITDDLNESEADVVMATPREETFEDTHQETPVQPMNDAFTDLVEKDDVKESDNNKEVDVINRSSPDNSSEHESDAQQSTNDATHAVSDSLSSVSEQVDQSTYEVLQSADKDEAASPDNNTQTTPESPRNDNEMRTLTDENNDDEEEQMTENEKILLRAQELMDVKKLTADEKRERLRKLSDRLKVSLLTRSEKQALTDQKHPIQINAANNAMSAIQRRRNARKQRLFQNSVSELCKSAGMDDKLAQIAIKTTTSQNHGCPIGGDAQAVELSDSEDSDMSDDAKSVQSEDPSLVIKAERPIGASPGDREVSVQTTSLEKPSNKKLSSIHDRIAQLKSEAAGLEQKLAKWSDAAKGKLAKAEFVAMMHPLIAHLSSTSHSNMTPPIGDEESLTKALGDKQTQTLLAQPEFDGSKKFQVRHGVTFQKNKTTQHVNLQGENSRKLLRSALKNTELLQAANAAARSRGYRSAIALEIGTLRRRQRRLKDSLAREEERLSRAEKEADMTIEEKGKHRAERLLARLSSLNRSQLSSSISSSKSDLENQSNIAPTQDETEQQESVASTGKSDLISPQQANERNQLGEANAEHHEATLQLSMSSDGSDSDNEEDLKLHMRKTTLLQKTNSTSETVSSTVTTTVKDDTQTKDRIGGDDIPMTNGIEIQPAHVSDKAMSVTNQTDRQTICATDTTPNATSSPISDTDISRNKSCVQSERTTVIQTKQLTDQNTQHAIRDSSTFGQPKHHLGADGKVTTAIKQKNLRNFFGKKMEMPQTTQTEISTKTSNRTITVQSSSDGPMDNETDSTDTHTSMTNRTPLATSKQSDNHQCISEDIIDEEDEDGGAELSDEEVEMKQHSTATFSRPTTRPSRYIHSSHVSNKTDLDEEHESVDHSDVDESGDDADDESGNETGDESGDEAEDENRQDTNSELDGNVQDDIEKNNDSIAQSDSSDQLKMATVSSKELSERQGPRNSKYAEMILRDQRREKERLKHRQEYRQKLLASGRTEEQIADLIAAEASEGEESDEDARRAALIGKFGDTRQLRLDGKTVAQAEEEQLERAALGEGIDLAEALEGIVDDVSSDEDDDVDQAFMAELQRKLDDKEFKAVVRAVQDGHARHRQRKKYSNNRTRAHLERDDEAEDALEEDDDEEAMERREAQRVERGVAEYDARVDDEDQDLAASDNDLFDTESDNESSKNDHEEEDGQSEQEDEPFDVQEALKRAVTRCRRRTIQKDDSNENEMNNTDESPTNTTNIPIKSIKRRRGAVMMSLGDESAQLPTSVTLQRSESAHVGPNSDGVHSTEFKRSRSADASVSLSNKLGDSNDISSHVSHTTSTTYTHTESYSTYRHDTLDWLEETEEQHMAETAIIRLDSNTIWQETQQQQLQMFSTTTVLHRNESHHDTLSFKTKHVDDTTQQKTITNKPSTPSEVTFNNQIESSEQPTTFREALQSMGVSLGDTKNGLTDQVDQPNKTSEIPSESIEIQADTQCESTSQWQQRLSSLVDWETQSHQLNLELTRQTSAPSTTGTTGTASRGGMVSAKTGRGFVFATGKRAEDLMNARMEPKQTEKQVQDTNTTNMMKPKPGAPLKRQRSALLTILSTDTNKRTRT